MSFIPKAENNRNSSASLGLFPLHSAIISNRSLEIFESYLVFADINLECSKKTPLMFSIEYGRPDCAKALIERGAKLDEVDDKGENALHIAAIEDDAATLTLLLDKAPQLINIPCRSGYTPTSFAVINGSSEALSVLIERGVDLKTRDPRHQDTALHFAVGNGEKAIALMLIKKDKSLLFLPNAEGVMPFDMIIDDDNFELLGQVLELYPDLLDSPYGTGQSLLHYAIMPDRWDLFNYLASYPNVDLEAKDPFGNTPLNCAVSAGIYEMVEMLCNNHANIYATDHVHHTPFLTGASKGNLTALKPLLRIDPTLIHSTTLSGDHCLHLAVESDNKELLAFLITAGADPFRTNHGGLLPLHVAALKNKKAALSCLLRHMQLIAPVLEENGNSLMHLAAASNSTGCLEYLIHEIGMDPNQKNKAGDTPLTLATANHATEAEALLTSSIPNPHEKPFLLLECLHESNALETRVIEDDYQGIEELFDFGYHHLKTNSDGKNAFEVAVTHAKEESLKLLLASDVKGVDFSRKAWSEDLEKHLNAMPFLSTIKDEREMTLLHWAVRSKDLNAVKLLSQNPTSLQVRNNWGLTPWHEAVLAEATDIISLFLSQDPGLFEQRTSVLVRGIEKSNCYTFLHLAFLHGKQNLLPGLIDKHPEKMFSKEGFFASDKNGNTPIYTLLIKEDDNSLNLIATTQAQRLTSSADLHSRLKVLSNQMKFLREFAKAPRFAPFKETFLRNTDVCRTMIFSLEFQEELASELHKLAEPLEGKDLEAVAATALFYATMLVDLLSLYRSFGDVPEKILSSPSHSKCLLIAQQARDLKRQETRDSNHEFNVADIMELLCFYPGDGTKAAWELVEAQSLYKCGVFSGLDLKVLGISPDLKDLYDKIKESKNLEEEKQLWDQVATVLEGKKEAFRKLRTLSGKLTNDINSLQSQIKAGITAEKEEGLLALLLSCHEGLFIEPLRVYLSQGPEDIESIIGEGSELSKLSFTLSDLYQLVSSQKSPSKHSKKAP